jgi:hypothetical protein
MDNMPHSQFTRRHFITVGLRNQILKAREAGLDIPVSRTILITGLKPDEIWVNMVRVSGTDSTEPASYTRCELTAHKQIKVLNEYLRRFVPGFENAHMEIVSPFTGIRESRVIVGKYVLTAEDIVSMRKFDDAVVPRHGVYAVRIQLASTLLTGMTNIGTRPTFDGHRLTIETHIFDFSNDIYGQPLSIEFVERLRDEQAFSTVDALAHQMALDAEQAKQILSHTI